MLKLRWNECTTVIPTLEKTHNGCFSETLRFTCKIWATVFIKVNPSFGLSQFISFPHHTNYSHTNQTIYPTILLQQCRKRRLILITNNYLSYLAQRGEKRIHTSKTFPRWVRASSSRIVLSYCSILRSAIFPRATRLAWLIRWFFAVAGARASRMRN